MCGKPYVETAPVLVVLGDEVGRRDDVARIRQIVFEEIMLFEIEKAVTSD